MYFVLAQTQVYGNTVPNNLRMGGYKHLDSAVKRALRDDRPCIIQNHARQVMAVTLNKEVIHGLGKEN